MAKTSITDVIEPAVFSPYVIVRTKELSRLVQSGIIQADPVFDEKADSGGLTIDMPFWNDLSGADEVLSEGALTPGGLTTGKDIAGILERGKAWEHSDLSGILAGDDPAKAVADLVAAYWARRFQAMTLSTLKGIFATAGMSGLVHEIHATSGGFSDVNYLTGSTFVDGCQKLGDAKEMLSGVAMHSAVEASLLKRDLIDFMPDSEGKPTIKVFQGKAVIIDDGLPVDVVNGANAYTTYLFGRGALALGNGATIQSKKAEGGFGTWGTEFYRTALAGSSGLINRRRMILHPRGIKWLGASVAGQTPTNAELENSANWERVYDVKHIRIVKIRHNVAA